MLSEGLMNETKVSAHLFDRLKERMSDFSDEDISSQEKGFLDQYLSILLNIDFDRNKSFAIKVLDLNVNKGSKHFRGVKGRNYYSINDFLGRDSTGNQIWVIVRRNTAITIMLRKDIQPVEKLRVDYVVNDISDLQKLIKNNLAK
jgi:hypothetical protein